MPHSLTATSTTAEAAWEVALDRYAEVLDEHRRQLAVFAGASGAVLDDLIPPVFVPPAGLPALPPTLVERALELDRATRDVLEQLAELRDRTRPTAGPSVTRLATPTGSTMLDRRM